MNIKLPSTNETITHGNSYCPFGVSNIEACDSPRNDLKVVSVIEMTFFVLLSVPGCISKTKKRGQTLDSKCSKVNLYGEMGI